jgi:hypothetical protein
MPWLPTPSRPTPTSALYNLGPVHQAVVVLTAILLLLIVVGFFLAKPIIIQFAPKSELGTWVPEGIKCDSSSGMARCWDIKGDNWG